MITSSLQIVYDWKQAEQVKQQVLLSSSTETQKSPLVFCEWYSEQGSIEWHDASITKWSSQMVAHLKEIKDTRVIGNEEKTFVIWNAQCMNQNDWYLWKDLKGGIRVIFVSDMYIPHIRLLGFPVTKYPLVNKEFAKLGHIIDTFFDMESLKKGIFDWKLIVEYRDEILQFLEWHSSTTIFKTYIQNKIVNKATELKINREGMHLLTQNGLHNLSVAKTKIEIVMACEYCFVYLIQLLMNHRGKQHSLK